jgi:hypothetical protein
MSSYLKKMVPIVVSSVFINYAAFATDDYGLRTIRDVSEQNSSRVSDSYDLIFSFAMVSKGASGYNNINNFNNLYLVLDKAKKADQLTTEGEELYLVTKTLGEYVKNLSPSKLTDNGKLLVTDLGANFAKNRQKLLLNKQDYDKEIAILFDYNGEQLALSTGENFVLGMTKSLPSDSQIVYMQEDNKAQTENEKILAFYDTNEYKRYLTNYPDLEKALGKILVARQTKAYIGNVIPRVFKKQFASEITHIGIVTDRRLMTKVEAKDFVNYLYEMYKFVPSINYDLSAKFAPVFNKVIWESERSYWSSIDDMRMFYRFGPGFDNQPISLNAAKKIFGSYESVVNDIESEIVDEPVKLYFVDAKAMISYISLLRGDFVGTSIAPNESFNVKDNNFIVSSMTPINSILIWDIYKSRDGKLLVKMKLNGQDVSFKHECKQSENSGLYEWHNLRKCILGNKELN